MGECYSIFDYSNVNTNTISDSYIIGITINFINNKCIIDSNKSISTSLLLDSYESYIKYQLSENKYSEWINNTSKYQRLSNIIDLILNEHNCYYTTPGCAIISGITLKESNWFWFFVYKPKEIPNT